MLLVSNILADEYGFDPVNTMPLDTDFQAFYDIRNICTPAAMVALAFCGIRWITAADSRTAGIAKNWLIAILAGVALFWLVPGLVHSIANTA